MATEPLASSPASERPEPPPHGTPDGPAPVAAAARRPMFRRPLSDLPPDELRRRSDRLADERRRQGLPPTVRDPLALRRLGRMLG